MNTERINITLPPKLLEQVDELCDLNMVSRSSFVRTAIRYYISSFDDEEEDE